MTTRRDFLRVSAGAAAGALILPGFAKAASGLAARSADKVAPGLARPEKVKKIGLQLYSVRKEMLADPTGTLKQLAKIGFKELESARSEKGNYYGLTPKEIKKITADLGMNLISGHVHLDNDWQKSIEEATETGQIYLVSAVLPSPGQTVENYQRAADAFSKAGQQCKAAGLVFAYHNHDSEFETVNGQVLYDILLNGVDPALVKMEMDLGWVMAAGYDPLTYFARYPGRFPLWHLKDMDMTRKQSTEFGKGKMDVAGLLRHARASGMKHFFVEQEEYAHSALESAGIDYDYLENLNY
jgi:sugar phosphate isomerase/epimerase